MGISVLVHGPHGAGKSTFGNSGPGPRLHLDAEGGANWLAGKKVYWTDLSKLPEGVDEDTTVIVSITSATTLEYAYQWLKSGQHPFKSVTLDSLSEMQKRVMDALAGTNQMQQADWGTLLRTLEKLVRDIKDLKVHPTNPLDAVVFICGSQRKEGEPWGPQLQGGIAQSVPFYVDVVGYAELLPTEEPGKFEQKLTILPVGGVVAKDRTRVLSDKYGAQMTNPSIKEILETTQQ